MNIGNKKKNLKKKNQVLMSAETSKRATIHRCSPKLGQLKSDKSSFLFNIHMIRIPVKTQTWILPACCRSSLLLDHVWGACFPAIIWVNKYQISITSPTQATWVFTGCCPLIYDNLHHVYKNPPACSA